MKRSFDVCSENVGNAQSFNGDDLDDDGMNAGDGDGYGENYKCITTNTTSMLATSHHGGILQKKLKRNSSLSYFHNLNNVQTTNSITLNGCRGMGINSGFELVGCFGSYGTQSGQFKNPSDVAIDFTYRLVFILDTDNRRCQVFDESTLTFKYMFETPYKPNAVTVHWDHTLIISFTRDSLICKYDFNGNEIWKWGGISTKAIMDSPTGVVVDFEGNIYVCDWFKHCILVFSSNGTLLKSIGGMGKENGQFAFPRDIDMDSAGNLIVSDSGNNRIQILNSDGEFQSSFGSLGFDQGEFQSPNSVFVDKSTGYIYLTEWDSHRISKFHPNNKFYGSGSIGIGGFGQDENSFKYPSGIAFCYGSSRLLVIDCGNHRIKIYRVT